MTDELGGPAADGDDGPSRNAPGSVASVRRRLPAPTWLRVAFVVGAALGVAWSLWETRGLRARLLKDMVLFLVGPAVLGLTYGRHLGWRVDRRAVRNAVLLALFVLPFYLVGSSLPTVRAYYPAWRTSSALAEFLPYALSQFVIALAAETYYRGLLCVGIREIGFKSVFVTPVLCAYHHLGKPPVEVLLAGPTDVLFGAVDYESESVFPSVVAHGAGMTLLDWLALHDPVLPPDRVVDWFSWLPFPL